MEDAEKLDDVDQPHMSVIGADILVTGNIEASADLHIEGRVIGDVRCATLVLGEASTVKGSIYADRVRVSGTVDGSVETKDLAIEATARVIGDVIYNRLRVANGGVIQGNLKHGAIEENGNGGKLKLVEARAEPADKQKAIYIE